MYLFIGCSKTAFVVEFYGCENLNNKKLIIIEELANLGVFSLFFYNIYLGIK
jgi:hypothetical protein